MKHFILCAVCALSLTLGLPVEALAQELTVGGQPVGIELQADGVTVAGFSELETSDGLRSPARDAGLREGDRIVSVGEREVASAEDLIAALEDLQGEEAAIGVRRGGGTETVSVQPVQNESGQWMLGLWLRDQSSGIGTLTFYDPASGIYGALGHGVCDETSGETLPIRGGVLTEAQIVSVKPGSRGVPGELSGCADRGAVLGSVELNSERGIYGRSDASLGEGIVETGEPVCGPARILTTLEGRRVMAYSVEISRVYTEGGAQRMTLTVTDPLLRELAGGIVQGMSGSPILQNGRLVGAVTHVLVST